MSESPSLQSDLKKIPAKVAAKLPSLSAVIKTLVGIALFLAAISILKMDAISPTKTDLGAVNLAQVQMDGKPLAEWRLLNLPVGKALQVDSFVALFALALLAFVIWKMVFPLFQNLAAAKPTILRREKRYLFTGIAALLLGFGLYSFFNARMTPETRVEPIPMGERDQMVSLAFSDNLDRVVGGTADGMAFIWSGNRQGAPNQIATRYTANFTTVAYAPSGDLMAIGDNNGSIRLWNQDGTQFKRQLIPNQGSITALTFNTDPNDMWLAAGHSSGAVSLWSLKPGAEYPLLKWQMQLHALDVTALAFDARTQFLASGSEDHSIRVLDVRNNARRADAEGHSYKILALGFKELPKNQVCLFTLSEHGKMITYDIPRYTAQAQTGNPALLNHKEIPLDPNVFWKTATFSPNVELFATANGKTVELRRPRGGGILDTIQLQDDVTSVRFDRAGEHLLTGENSGVVQVWTLKRKQLPKNWQTKKGLGAMQLVGATGQPMPHSGNAVTALAWNDASNISMFTVTNQQNTAFVFEHVLPGENKVYRKMMGPGDDIVQAAFGANNALVTLTRDNYVRAWQVGGDAASFMSEMGWMDAPLNALALHPTAPFALVGNSQGALRMWNWSDGSFIKSDQMHLAEISAVAFTPQGDVAATADQAGNLILWRLNDLTQPFIQPQCVTLNDKPAHAQCVMPNDKPAHERRIATLAFSRDGQLLASAGLENENNVKIWRVSDGTLVTSKNVPTMRVARLTFDSGGKKLAVAGDSARVTVLDVGSDVQKEFDAHVEPIMALGITSDNKLVAAGMNGNQMEEWVSANLTDMTPPEVTNALENIFLPFPALRFGLAFALPALLTLGYLLYSFNRSNAEIADFMYKELPNYDPAKARAHIAQVRDGKAPFKQTLYLSQPQVTNEPGTETPKPEGPGVLIVPEGFATVIEREKNVTRILDSGSYVLAKGEAAVMAIPLYTRTEKIEIDDVMTRDQMRFEKIKVSVHHKIQGIQNRYTEIQAIKKRGETPPPHYKAKYDFNQDVIHYLIWNPEHTDYTDLLKAYVTSQVRELVGGEYFEDLYSGFGGAQQELKKELEQRARKYMNERGVDIESLTVTDLQLDDKIAKALQRRKRAELDRQVGIAKAQTTRDINVIRQDAKAALRSELIRQIADPLRDQKRGVIIDSAIAVRYIEAIERLSINFYKEDLEEVRPAGDKKPEAAPKARTVDADILAGESSPINVVVDMHAARGGAATST